MKGEYCIDWLMGRASLINLPYEPLLEVLLLLSIDDIKSIRLVNHCLYATSEALELWQSLARNLLQSSGRELTMDPTRQLEVLSLREVKQAILRTSALAHRWRSGSGHHTNRLMKGQTNSRLLKLHPPDGGRIESVFLTENFAFLHSGGYLLCFRMNGEFVKAIELDPMLDENVSFLFDEGENVLYTVLLGSPNPFIPMQISKFVIEGTDVAPKFFSLRCLNLPGRWNVFAYTDHFKSKTAFLLVEPLVNRVVRLRLVGIFKIDTDESTCCMVDTSLLTISKSGERLSCGIHFSADDDNVIVSQERSGFWTQQSYSISELSAASLGIPPHDARHFEIYPAKPPVFKSELPKEMMDPLAQSSCAEDGGCQSAHVLQRYTKAHMPFQSCPSSESLSHILLYRIDEQHTRAKIYPRWCLVQLYTMREGLFLETSNANSVSHIPLSDPVLDPTTSEPIFDAAMNFAVWIDREIEKKRYRPSFKKRVVKIAAFQDIGGDCWTTDPKPLVITTLSSLPSSVVDRARKILIRPSLASIFIITTSNELHRFVYI